MTTVYGIEFDYLKLGTNEDDTLNGGNGDGFINGLDGQDTIVGFGGNDLILGDDIPIEDYIDLNSEAVQQALVALYESVQSRDLSDFSIEDIQYALFEVQNFIVENPEFLSVLATQGDSDMLIGGAGNDMIYGGAGDDVIRGGSGDDMLIGFAGDNLLLGGEGSDVITGGIGNDRLYGNSGEDYLVGTSGSDFYFGGEGSDYFMFTRLLDIEESTDRIVDFEQGTDKVVLFNIATDFQDLAFNQSGPTVEIQVSENHTIIFNNSQVENFTADDFIFYNL
ncbi:calcium-binding protein [Grimontia sp. SpTr1]|uniref:calcium-binding protein n=1 Tax=Grimontia sp. SpTr1 TaxID=2995319 RepID=UPI00248D1E19|nr:calcium-binding protein [Grimontia sp. SpTr1]